MAHIDRFNSKPSDPYASHVRADAALQPVSSSSSVLWAVGLVVLLIVGAVLSSAFFGGEDATPTPGTSQPAILAPNDGAPGAPVLGETSGTSPAGEAVTPAQ